MVSRTRCKRPRSLIHDDFSFNKEKILGLEILFRDRAKIKRKKSTGESAIFSVVPCRYDSDTRTRN